MAYAATKLFAGWLNFILSRWDTFNLRKGRSLFLGKIFLGFLVPLNHFQVPISSLLLLVPRNLLEPIRMVIYRFLVCAGSFCKNA